MEGVHRSCAHSGPHRQRQRSNRAACFQTGPSESLTRRGDVGGLERYRWRFLCSTLAARSSNQWRAACLGSPTNCTIRARPAMEGNDLGEDPGPVRLQARKRDPVLRRLSLSTRFTLAPGRPALSKCKARRGILAFRDALAFKDSQ